MSYLSQAEHSIENSVAQAFANTIAFLEHNSSPTTAATVAGSAATVNVAAEAAVAQAKTSISTVASTVENALAAVVTPLADDVVVYLLSKVPGGVLVAGPAEDLVNAVISKLTALIPATH